MATQTYNPYIADAALLSDGLDYVIANLASTPTFYDLLETCEDYLYTLIPGAPASVGLGMRITLTNTYNAYVNNKIEQNLNYDIDQLLFVNAAYKGIKSQSINSLEDFLVSGRQQLAMDTFSTFSKGPAYYALMEAEVSYNYWLTKVSTPGGWATYFDSNAAINYSNIPHWVAAAYVASYAGWSQGQEVNLNFPIPSQQPGIAVMLTKTAAMLSALMLTSGEVIFRWSNRPTITKQF